MKLTKALFYVSHTFAWLLILFSVASSIAYPILGPTLAKIDSEELTHQEIFVTTSGFILVALCAFAITRRKILGSIILLAIFSCLKNPIGIIFMLLATLIFFTPFALAFFEARRLEAITSDA